MIRKKRKQGLKERKPGEKNKYERQEVIKEGRKDKWERKNR